jgi:hypothetical protein
MKTIQIALRTVSAVCFAFIMSSASCDLFENIPDVSFDAALPLTFTVQENGTFTNKAYSNTQTLDATSNAEVAKYKDKIKEFTVNSVTYKITNYSSTPPGTAVTFSTGKMSFGAVGAVASTVATLGSVNLLSASSGSGAAQTLTIDQAGLNAMASTLLADKKIDVATSGVLSSTPVSFKVETIFNVTIKASPLK